LLKNLDENRALVSNQAENTCGIDRMLPIGEQPFAMEKDWLAAPRKVVA
jgi:hypothetical protein